MRFEETLGLSRILKLTEHELCQALEVRLKRRGLTLPQYSALSCLEEKPLATNADLARKSGVSAQTMNRIMQNLERDGFVSKQPSAEHGLKQEFVMTPKAMRHLCDAHIEVNEIELEMVKGLTKVHLKELQRMLESCLENLKLDRERD